MKRFAIIILLSHALACSFVGAETAPTPSSSAAPSFFPILPLIVEFEYTPHYFMQWLNDQQYARIEVALLDEKSQTFNLALTEKSGRRINYTNSEERVARLKRAELEIRLTKIDYRADNRFGQLPAHEFSFTDEKGQFIRWRFTLAAPASDRGAGLTPQEGGDGWRLIYRELGSAAGEGTAVQIGGKVIEAEAWPEISAPPYFVAYRGAYAAGMGMGFFAAGQQNWRLASAPGALSEGAEWLLNDDRGRAKKLKLTALRGDELTISETPSGQGSALSVQARRTATGLALKALMLTDKGKNLRLSFTPELDLTAASSSPYAFQIDQNGHNKILQGSVFVERKGAETHLRWQPKAPDWAKNRILKTTLTIGDQGYKVEVR